MTASLPLEHPWAWALGACIVAAALEGILAGRNVKRRFAELQFPRPALPLWAWSIVGLGYYVVFFVVLHSLLGRTPTPGWTGAALALVAVLLAANAVWNWLFFRRKDLWISFAFSVPYALLAITLAWVLFRIGSQMAGWYLLYIIYLAYGTWWGYGVWRLNRPSQQPGQGPQKAAI